MEEASDAELLERVRKGDRLAFAALVDRHKRPIVRYLARMTASSDRAEDLAQETFVRLLTATPRRADDGQIAPWLYRTATNLCRSEHRRVQRQRLLKLALGQNGVAGTLPVGCIPAAGLSQEVRLLAAEAQQELARAVARLPIRYRAALVLHEIDDLPYDEVARLTGWPEGTVKSRVSRGRALLKRKLARYWNGGKA